jgi:Sigma-70 region 2
MDALIFHVISWPTLGCALLVYGFAPGALLRVIVLFYPQGHPRRRELIGELYAYPRIKRPFWVAEQLETALFEGLGDRIAARRASRMRKAERIQRLLEMGPWEWQRLVDQHARLIWSITAEFKLAESDAADVAQATWLRLLDYIERVEYPDRVDSWLAATARNECLGSLRTRNIEPSQGETVRPPGGLD